MKVYHTSSTTETQECAKDLAESIRPGDVVCLSGELGAGKTTFAQALLAFFGAKGPYTSPTFTIVKEYAIPSHDRIQVIYHVDAYRIGPDDLETIGWRDMVLRRDVVTLLEWPERFEDAIPDGAVWVTFAVDGESERTIKIERR